MKGRIMSPQIGEVLGVAKKGTVFRLLDRRPVADFTVEETEWGYNHPLVFQFGAPDSGLGIEVSWQRPTCYICCGQDGQGNPLLGRMAGIESDVGRVEVMKRVGGQDMLRYRLGRIRVKGDFSLLREIGERVFARVRGRLR